jgi:hypothetical protein
VGAGGGVGGGAGGSAAPTYAAIESWGWEQNKEFVEVLCLSGLTGVGALPKEAITCDFHADSFDLKVHGLAGKNLRLRITNLEKDIVPARSRVEVRKNRIVLHLRKAGEWDHWMELVSKRPRKAGGEGGAGADKGKGKAGEDPSNALMDMMRQVRACLVQPAEKGGGRSAWGASTPRLSPSPRPLAARVQMYEDGDDATRKVIAEAWMKSREDQARGGGGGGGMPGGARAGAGSKKRKADAMSGGLGLGGFGDDLDDDALGGL